MALANTAADAAPTETPAATPSAGSPTDLTPQEGATPVETPVAETPNAEAEPQGGTPITEGAPETYADFTLPEGVELSQGALDAFLPVAKELNLTQVQAQALVDLQTGQQTAQVEEAQKAWDTQNEQWVESAKSDVEIGGAQHDEKVAVAMKAVKQFGTQELLEVFDATGVGNHPEMIRFFYRIGKLMENDKIHFGNAQDSQPKTAASILFPDMPQE